MNRSGVFARTLALAALVACSPDPSPTSGGTTLLLTHRHRFEEGAVLSPDDLARGGEAGPAALALADGKLFVLLQNLDRYSPAGPSHLAALEPATLRPLWVKPLVFEAETGLLSCRNATALLTTAERLLVVCAGRVALPPDATTDGALLETDFEGNVLRRVAVGRSPGSVTLAGGFAWMGDGEGGGVSRVDLAAFKAISGADGEGLVRVCEQSSTKAGFVSAVLQAEGRLFAACFNDDRLMELDPATGERVGSGWPTGAGPLLIHAVDGRLFVLDDLGGTVSIFDLATNRMERAAAYLGREGTQGGNDPQGIAGSGAELGITNSAYGTFVLLSFEGGEPRLSAALDLKPTPTSPTNFPTAVAHDGTAYFVAIPGLEFDTRNIPSEVVRIEVRR
jgi:hypothetical protein